MNLGGNIFKSFFFRFRPGIYFGDFLQDLKGHLRHLKRFQIFRLPSLFQRC